MSSSRTLRERGAVVEEEIEDSVPHEHVLRHALLLDAHFNCIAIDIASNYQQHIHIVRHL